MVLVSIFNWMMKKPMKSLSLILCGLLSLATQAVHAQVLPNLGGQRAGISAMPFLKNDLSPKSVSMGGASVALNGEPYSMTVNPAAASNMEHPVLAFSTRIMPAGLFQSYLSGIYKTENKTAWMFSMNYLSSGAQKRRTEFQPLGDGSVYSSDAMKFGVGYSRALSKMFSFGVNANFIREQLAQYSANAVTVDLGFLYRTDWKDLSFAVSLQHFGGNSTLSGSDLAVMYNRSGGVTTESYGAPTMFSMGVSMVPFQQGVHQILTSAQLNHPNDNAENIRLGAQYGYDSLLFVRVGYRLNVQGENFSAGVGVRTRVGAFPLSVEYAVLPNRFLGVIHSIGLSIGFHKVGQ
jgi:hypothetical protein